MYTIILKGLATSHMNIFKGPYGKAPERYSEVGLALRECTNNGWATTVSSDCATKFTISTTEANEYFEETELSDSNVEEYTETIIQVKS